MSIPLNISPLGFTLALPAGELPAGYTRLAFLESIANGSSSFLTDVIPNAETGLLADGFFTSDTESWAITANEWPNYFYFCCGFAGTGRKQLCIGQAGNGNQPVRVNYDASTRFLAYVNYKNSQIIELVRDGEAVTRSMHSAITQMTAAFRFFWKGCHYRLYSAQFTQGTDIIRDCIPCVDSAGTPTIYDKLTGAEYRATSEANKNNVLCGFETLDQLTALAANLPTVTGTPEIKLSLPGEWNGDASANAQLSIITGKGWSTTITYRDVETSTSSSFVLGNRGDGGSALVLWCRAEESEYGNYQDADGVRYYVETCHDIWHPQELSPDDLGYTAVLTLEDYLTERGLTAVVYEEDENFTTN